MSKQMLIEYLDRYDNQHHDKDKYIYSYVCQYSHSVTVICKLLEKSDIVDKDECHAMVDIYSGCEVVDVVNNNGYGEKFDEPMKIHVFTKNTKKTETYFSSEIINLKLGNIIDKPHYVAGYDDYEEYIKEYNGCLCIY